VSDPPIYPADLALIHIMSTKLPKLGKKKNKNKNKKMETTASAQMMPDGKMFSLMERRGVYSDKTTEAQIIAKKKKKSGKDRAKTLKKIKKSQKKEALKTNKKNKGKQSDQWSEERERKARLKKASKLVDTLDRNCDPDKKKNNKAARRRQRSLQLQSLKANNGPSNMPLPKKIEKKKVEEPPTTEAKKEEEEEEQISSDEEQQEYDHERTNKERRRKYVNTDGAVPEEMQKKKWQGFGCKMTNPFTKLKRHCGEKAMACGSAFRFRFQKKKAINLDVILAPESHKFSIQLEKQLSNKADHGLLERSTETKPDGKTGGVLEKEVKVLNSSDQAKKDLADAETLAAGGVIEDEVEELTIRTALEVICKRISGVDCLALLKPEKMYEFFQFDLMVRNTLDLFPETQHLKTCSLGQLIVFANRESTSGELNCVSVGMFVDEEAQRAMKRKHDAENWTCFFCYALQKNEDDACTKCGQLKIDSEKSKRQEDRRLEKKKREKEEKAEKKAGKDLDAS